MKTKKKTSEAGGRGGESVPSGHNRVKGYTRARFTNAQGDRDEVLLFDPTDEAYEPDLAVENPVELRVDLTRALSMFTLQERKVIFNVYVKNQPVTLATRRMRKHDARWWRDWLRTTALPKLRKRLADYNENGRVVL